MSYHEYVGRFLTEKIRRGNHIYTTADGIKVTDGVATYHIETKPDSAYFGHLVRTKTDDYGRIEGRAFMNEQAQWVVIP